MRSSSLWAVLVVVLCAGAVVGALGWASAHALRLEGRELQARAEAHQQESIRLALWRMDSAINAVVGRESVRPYFQYSAFYPADRAYTSMWEEVKPGEVVVPSPLLDPGDGFILLHFQRDEKGEITSPQAPSGNMLDLAESAYVSSERVIAAQGRLHDLAGILAAERAAGRALRAALADKDDAGGEPEAQTLAAADARAPIGQSANAPATQSYREFEVRKQVADLARAQQQERVDRKAQNVVVNTPVVAESAPTPASAQAGAGAPRPGPGKEAFRGKLEDKAQTRDEFDSPEQALGVALGGAGDPGKKANEIQDDLTADPTRPGVEQGEFSPVWRVDPRTSRPVLLLLRKVRIGTTELQQGCWLNWDTLRVSLVESIRDLLPGAALVPLLDANTARPELLGRRLAGIAAELDPGPLPTLPPPGWTPMRTTLVLTWGAVLLALVAIAGVLHAARELAERRGRFVSAVTHELRTPLTTFCLYSQMLADGMVADEPSRAEYLGTLKRESQRLARIVENVLEFARLGRRAPPKRPEPLTVPDLLLRLSPVLEQRAAQAGLRLVMDPITPELGETSLRVEPLTVERILFNLVDNACKYAADGAEPVVGLSVRQARGSVEFTVTDHGHGIEPGVRSLLFRPFQRGQSLAHASTPGLGLGLALSRALARQVGGDLVLTRSAPDGSRFTLTLPADSVRA